ncbi:MAG TPA: peptide chain release factor N(5)-glutamine methyltransferase [Bryobacteraceae bacterium]|nr:peptide chain release factor N(5)-glutamine methyltransferase [Bryobacteraceae bacterium]
MTRTLPTKASQQLAAAGIDNPRLDARVLLAHALAISPSDLIFETTNIPPEALAKFESAIARRTNREPLAYITGEKEFWSLPFAVGPGVLIPRPETETVIEEAQKLFPQKNTPLRILDLGTGSGILLLTLLHLYPNARGTGVDASPDALHWAKKNAASLGLESRAALEQRNWDEGIEQAFDLIVSNPPYIARDALAQLEPELSFEPRAALDGGPDGLDAYRALAPILLRRAAPGGAILLEIGADQGASVPAILEAAGLLIGHVANDLAGHPRVVVAKKALETGR